MQKLLKRIWHNFLEGNTVGGGHSAPPRTFHGTYRVALLLIVLFELLSMCAWLVPALSSPIFVLIIGITAYLAATRIDLAMLVLLAELFIGSQGGYMVTLGAEQGLEMSLRHGLFLIIVFVWFAELVASTAAGGARRKEAWAWWGALRQHKLLYPYLGVLAMICYGVARGLAQHHGYGLVFFDGDRYLYYGLFPALVTAFAKPNMLRHAGAVLAAAVTTCVAKALVVLFFFSHRVFVVAKALYLWVRDTRVGEITIQTADFYRIFFQSQIFILVALFAVALLFAYAANDSGRMARRALAFVCWAMVAMVLSLSRSFWFGGAVGVIALVAILGLVRAEPKIWARLGLLGIGSVYVAVAIIAAVYFFPFPNKSGSLSISSLLGQRALSLSDDAAKSRWALLPKLNEAAMEHPVLGSGFGRTVTYETHDPRLLASNKTGSYTTYAFEWGYHDLWLKLGFLGLALYGWFLVRLLGPLVHSIYHARKEFRRADLGENDNAKRRTVLTLGLLVGAVALLATNLFSPYLNHPLGIGILMLIGAMIAAGEVKMQKD